MRKKLFATLPLVALASTAFAQSSVNLYGNIDQGVTYINGDKNWSGLESGGNRDSFIGFRGTEDLGKGLKAQFTLESGILGDTGSGDSGNGLNFKRRATVGVLGNFGELNLGRDETTAYRSMKRYDVFNNAGIGGTKMWGPNNYANPTPGTPAFSYDARRKDNLIGYTSPSWSGFSVGANYGFGESSSDTWKTGAYAGVTANYDNGAWSATLAAEQQNGITVPVGINTTADMRERAYSAGVGYDFGPAKVAAAYRRSDLKNNAVGSLQGDTYTVGMAAPVGAAGVVKASYNRYDRETFGGADAKADQLSVGYEHNLSKRTAMYGTYSYLKNKNGMGLSLNDNVSADGKGKQHGVQVGMRHSF